MKHRVLKPAELCAARSADMFAITQLHAPASVGTASKQMYPTLLFPNLVDFSLIQKQLFYSHFGDCTRKARNTCSGSKCYFAHFICVGVLR